MGWILAFPSVFEAWASNFVLDMKVDRPNTLCGFSSLVYAPVLALLMNYTHATSSGYASKLNDNY